MSSNILYYRVIPSHAELVYMKTYMNQAVAGKYERININLPQWRFVKHRYDEFGGFTTNWSDTIYPMITCALRELAYDEGLDLQSFDIDLEKGKVTYAFRELDKRSPSYAYSFHITVSQFHKKNIIFDRKTLNIDMTNLYDFMGIPNSGAV